MGTGRYSFYQKREARHRDTREIITQMVNSPASYAETPRNSQLIRRFRRMQPLARGKASSEVVGLRVHWYARFFDAQNLNLPDGRWQFSFDQRGKYLPHPSSKLTYLTVSLNAFPGLDTLSRGQRVELFGTIERVDFVLGITLEPDRIVILPLSLLDRLIGFFNR